MVEIRFTPQALEDLDGLLTYWRELNVETAKFQVQRIRGRVEILKTFPNIGRVVPELGYEKVRELIEGRFRIVYHLLSEEKITILTIHHSARPLDVEKLKPHQF